MTGRFKAGFFSKMIGILLSCFFVFELVVTDCLVVHAEETIDENKLYARAAVLMDGNSGRVLFSKNGDEALPMASTTKIMTCILALERGSQTDQVVFSKNAASMPEVALGAGVGDTFYMKDLLYSLMLESHNDTAVAIAEYIAGSVPAFAEIMNKKAQEIGCLETHYVTPNGLDDEDAGGIHHTSAADLARVMGYCLSGSPQKEAFKEITQTMSYTFADSQGKSYSCTNHNQLFSMMDGVVSGKTGFTTDAGYCYVGAVEQDKRLFIVALLGCGWPGNKDYKWMDAKSILNYGIEHYEFKSFKDILNEKDIDKNIVVYNAQDGNMQTKMVEKTLNIDEEKDDEGISGLLLGAGEDLTVNVELPENLQAPLEAMTVVGHVNLSEGEKVWHSYDLYLPEAVLAIDYPWCLKKVFEVFICTSLID